VKLPTEKYCCILIINVKNIDSNFDEMTNMAFISDDEGEIASLIDFQPQLLPHKSPC
jgi:hypothetical protein